MNEEDFDYEDYDLWERAFYWWWWYIVNKEDTNNLSGWNRDVKVFREKTR
jgi:hypothetical protein